MPRDYELHEGLKKEKKCCVPKKAGFDDLYRIIFVFYPKEYDNLDKLLTRLLLPDLY